METFFYFYPFIILNNHVKCIYSELTLKLSYLPDDSSGILDRLPVVIQRILL